MKKHYFIALILGLLLSSCSKETEDIPLNSHPYGPDIECIFSDTKGTDLTTNLNVTPSPNDSKFYYLAKNEYTLKVVVNGKELDEETNIAFGWDGKYKYLSFGSMKARNTALYAKDKVSYIDFIFSCPKIYGNNNPHKFTSTWVGEEGLRSRGDVLYDGNILENNDGQNSYCLKVLIDK